MTEKQLALIHDLDMAHIELNDIVYLMDEVADNFFDRYDLKNADDLLMVKKYFPRYAAFFRVAHNCIYQLKSSLVTGNQARAILAEKEATKDSDHPTKEQAEGLA